MCKQCGVEYIGKCDGCDQEHDISTGHLYGDPGDGTLRFFHDINCLVKFLETRADVRIDA